MRSVELESESLLSPRSDGRSPGVTSNRKKVVGLSLTAMFILAALYFFAALQRGIFGMGAQTLYCVAVMSGNESDLIRTSLTVGRGTDVGIFNCDYFSLFSSERLYLGQHWKFGAIHTTPFNMSVLVGETSGNSSGNTLVFINMWDAVYALGHYHHYDWTVKVDPDTVLFPGRLRKSLRHHPNGSFGLNCKSYGTDGLVPTDPRKLERRYMLGALEVFSREAMWQYYNLSNVGQTESCIGKDVNLSEMGEDIFMMKCLSRLGTVAAHRFDNSDTIADVYCHPEFRCDRKHYNTGFGFLPPWVQHLFLFYTSPNSDCDCNGYHAAYHPYKSNSSWMSCVENASTALSLGNCPECAPRRVPPDVVIPFYERDLCRLRYTLASIVEHDPHHRLGDVFLLWVSEKSIKHFQQQVEDVTQSIRANRNVNILEFIYTRPADGSWNGWHLQQIVKLKASTLVRSDFYMILDSKNALIRDIEQDEFFTPCNQGKMEGKISIHELGHWFPINLWYNRSAEVLDVSPPEKGYWPSSITPFLFHKQTVINLLQSIGENPSISSDNASYAGPGPLRDMLVQKNVTEITLYVLFARSRQRFPTFDCIHLVDKSTSWGITLWRQARDNLRMSKAVARGRLSPLTFGAESRTLDHMENSTTAQEMRKMKKEILEIYRQAHVMESVASIPNASEAEEADEFLQCVLS
eukprot:TRINITY_DN27862_c0_g1_i1.p1 TRINITY_DN27862_c0_g1~~TRINITY_DN27862_c0_g1_i1.p1  ORF type:complete len:691 (+),score=77.22 TRINITY_DN27862_c0_g1_i1:31-2103(+)